MADARGMLSDAGSAAPQDSPDASPARRFGWSDMFLHPDEDPRSGGGFEGELATLVGRLEDQRLTLELKCAGLGPEELARRSVAPSDLSLLGLVRHLTEVELGWFRRVMSGQDAPWPYRTEADGDAAFSGAAPDADVVARAWEGWRAEVAFARRLTAGATDLSVVGLHRGEPIQLRDVLVHMIEEYARHNGHADFLRERIDGRVGE